MKFVDLLSYYLLGSQKSDPSGSPKTNKNIEKEESLETNNKMNRHTQCQSDINSKVK